MKTNINVIAILADFLGSFFRKYFNTNLKHFTKNNEELSKQIQDITYKYAPYYGSNESRSCLHLCQNFFNSRECIVWLQKIINELNLDFRVTREYINNIMTKYYDTYYYILAGYTKEESEKTSNNPVTYLNTN